MNRIARSDEDYVRRQCHEVAREKMNQNNMQTEDGQYLPDMLIMTGPSGVGKTEIALQIVKEESKRVRNVRQFQIRCESTETFLRDINIINKRHDLHLESLENMYQQINMADILGDLFAVLNEQYPNHIKYLLFIDAERSTDLIRHINDRICEPVTVENYGNWKVIVTTTDDNKAEWRHGCDFVKERDFTDITVFQKTETRQFFEKDLHLGVISEEQLDEIYPKLGGLPGVLASLKKGLNENVLTTPEAYLRELFRRLDSGDARIPINNWFKASFKMLEGYLEHPKLGLALIKMISLLDEENITADIFIALAEVAIGNDRQHDIRPVDLGNEVLNQMIKRSLCEVMDSPAGQRIVSLHKLVRQGASLIFQEDSKEEQISTIRNCLIALTRIIPKDGRMHLSHIIYSCIYSHASRLGKEVESLSVRERVRASHPEALLLYSSMLSSMAYLLLAQRRPLEEATELLNKALDVYFELLTGDNSQEGNHDEKLEHLIGMLKDGRNDIIDQPGYAELVENLSCFFRLAEKDLKWAGVKKDELEDSHIPPNCLSVLIDNGKIIEVQVQKKIYLIEILLENLSVRVRSHNFSAKADPKKALHYAKAAYSLCGHVRQTHEKSLMAEVIIKRSVLEMELKYGRHQTIDSIKDIQRKFVDLADVGNDDNRRYGYEYGVRRTDFSKDDYHRLLCKEGRAACFGKLYIKAIQEGQDRDAAGFLEQGEESFKALIENEQSGNLQTLSKLYRRYAEFLADCGNNDEAVKASLDAMIYLHKHLKKTISNATGHPELDNCGKFTDLYVRLKGYYRAWRKASPNRCTMIVSDGNDTDRVNYLRSFQEKYRRNNPADAKGRYPIMEELYDDDDAAYRAHGDQNDYVAAETAPPQ